MAQLAQSDLSKEGLGGLSPKVASPMITVKELIERLKTMPEDAPVNTQVNVYYEDQHHCCTLPLQHVCTLQGDNHMHMKAGEVYLIPSEDIDL
jgi:hypothetical protein